MRHRTGNAPGLAAAIAIAFLSAACGGGDPAPMAGAFDASFGTGGLAQPAHSLSARATAAVHATVDEAGRIWVSGGTTEPGNAIHGRLLPDGSADSSFGAGGVIAQPAVPNADPFAAIAGRAAFPDRAGGARLFQGVSVAGCATGPSCGPAGGFRLVTDARVARVDDRGDPVASHGIGGAVTVTAESVFDAVPDASGGVVVLVAARRDAFDPAPGNRVHRIDSQGSRDTGFEARAASALECPGFERGAPALARLAAMPDGRLVVAQSFVAAPAGTPRLCVSRLLPDGSPDATWGTAGRSVVEEPSGPPPAVLNLLHLGANADGSVEIVVTFVPERIDPARPLFAVVPLGSTGRPDPARLAAGAFAGAGMPVAMASAFARDAKGRFLVAGYPYGPAAPGVRIEQPRVARYGPDGALDESFGVSGPGFTTLRFDSPASRLAPRHVHVSGESLLVAGSAVFDDPRVPPRFALARLSGR